MKIALIYFGQPRWINNPHCLETQQRNIFSQGDVDVFAHLWAYKAEDYSSSSWSNMPSCPSTPNDISTFIKNYNPVSYKTEIDPGFSSPEILYAINHRTPETAAYGGIVTERNFNICLSHLYSLEKAIEVFEYYVEQHKVEYDFVIFMRTDLCIWEFPKLNELQKGYFYFSSLFHSDHFADLCYITDQRFVCGLKAYSYLTDPSQEIVKNLTMGNAEQIKRLTFLKQFNKEVLRQVPIPVRVVRGPNDIGRQW